MATNDPAWAKFQGLLKKTMAEKRVTAADLAKALTTEDLPVRREQVENWRRGTSTPPLTLIRPIARVLGIEGEEISDSLHILKVMGIIDEPPGSDVVVDTAFRLLKLQTKLEDAHELATASGRRGGAGRVVTAAMASGEWAVACWPVVEGPPGCRMRIADRIDIRRVDGGATDCDQVWADPAMKSALRSARAFPGRYSPRWPDRGEEDEGTIARWAVSHVGAPKSPVVPTAKPELLTMAFTATTVDSWVNDVASLIGLLIGYGLSTTRDMAIEITGTTSHSDIDRAAIHERFLRETPRRRVWSHFTGIGPAPFTDAAGRVNNQVFHVHLVESDELLDYSARWRDRNLGKLRESSRRAQDQAGLVRADRLHLVPMGYREDRDDRWQLVLEAVRGIYRRLNQQDLLPDDLSLIHQTQWLRERDIVRPLLDYLGLPQPVAAEPRIIA